MFLISPFLSILKYFFYVSLQDKGVLLTTYDIVRNNTKSLQGRGYFDDDESEDSPTWDYMILDEVRMCLLYVRLEPV